jgi:hypothetical protein
LSTTCKSFSSIISCMQCAVQLLEICPIHVKMPHIQDDTVYV